MRLRVTSLLLLLALVLVGCGGNDDNSSSTSASTPGASATASGGTTAAACPTENTRNFAKTRFAADIGGTAFLVRRYVYQPYTQGKFQKGANGRTAALIKAGLATAASAKLLKNARENAQANPTLCKTIAGPLATLSDRLSGAVSAIRSGNFTGVAGLGGLLDSIKGIAGKAGVPITEKSVPLS